MVANNWLGTEGSRFSEETAKWFRKATKKGNSTLGLEAQEAGEKPDIESRERAEEKKGGGTKDQTQTMEQAYKFGGKSLVLLQVNCRNIYNKAIEFCNAVDTYNRDIIVGTELWLRDEIGNTEIFRADYRTFRRDRHTRGGGGGLFVLKIILPALSFGSTTILR